MAKTKVLIVDDSALMRQLLSELLGREPALQVVGVAPDPYVAWDKIQTLAPDVLTLDVEMPKMDGLTFLEKLMRAHPMPVVMVSSLTQNGCETTLRALELGAIDFVSKPKIDVASGTADIARELVDKIKMAALARPRAYRGRSAASSAKQHVQPRREALLKSTDQVIAIGSSTGGTEALRQVLVQLPPDSPGIVIVQHMPEKFTKHFAERLDKLCQIRVAEAQDGDRILRGHALIAPGNRHMQVKRSGAHYAVELNDLPPVNHHRPSVDVLFESCARFLGANVVGVILTGMGGDGARGLLSMRRNGARTIAQDEATCVVFGMPKEAIANGSVEFVAPLDQIAASILERVSMATD
jgi:two-component system chemotaxis response regulator CheB